MVYVYGTSPHGPNSRVKAERELNRFTISVKVSRHHEPLWVVQMYASKASVGRSDIDGAMESKGLELKLS